MKYKISRKVGHGVRENRLRRSENKAALWASRAIKRLDSVQRAQGSYRRVLCSRGLASTCWTLCVGLSEAGIMWKKEFRLLLNMEPKQSMILYQRKGHPLSSPTLSKKWNTRFLSVKTQHVHSFRQHTYSNAWFWRYHTLGAKRNCILDTCNTTC